MSDPQIQKLLIVQDRDTSLQKIVQELDRIPIERAVIERLVAQEEDNIEKASHGLKEKEVRRHELDVEVKSKEAALVRFRTQQLEIKKNDDYRAMTQQISKTELEVEQLEETEIELMLEIDTTREAFDAEKAVIEQRIAGQKREVVLLGEREANLKGSVGEAAAALEGARTQADESFLGHYDRVRKLTKRAPYVVQIAEHKCCGCHLRVSNEVSKTAFDHGEPHFCDQCARMVFA